MTASPTTNTIHAPRSSANGTAAMLNAEARDSSPWHRAAAARVMPQVAQGIPVSRRNGQVLGSQSAKPSRNATAASKTTTSHHNARDRIPPQPNLSELPWASFMIPMPTMAKSTKAQMPQPPAVTSFSMPSPV